MSTEVPIGFLTTPLIGYEGEASCFVFVFFKINYIAKLTLYANIRIHTLFQSLSTFPVVITRRVCMTIRSFLNYI